MKMMHGLEEMADKLASAPFFKDAPRKALEDLVIDSDITLIRSGNVFIHEGEYEEICYITLSGRYRIAVTDKKSGKKREVKILGTGEVLGEMSAMSGNPRFAEVSCVDDGQTLKVHRNDLLRFLDAAPEVKERIDIDYRKRILYTTLRKLDIFSLVDDKSIETLSTQVSMVVFEKGEKIFEEGGEPDAFYLIREGSIKMSRKMQGKDIEVFDSRFDKGVNPYRVKEEQEFTLVYLGSGAYFGERALFSMRKRTLSATALARSELVRIALDDFDELMERHPQLEMKLREIAGSRYKERAKDIDPAKQEILSWVESHDIMVGGKILFLDLDLCVRCLNCIDTCAKLHNGVTRLTHNGLRFKSMLIPTSCRHCREPTCMIDCPTGAIQRDIDGEVFHTDACIGCGSCAKLCPFGNISIVKSDKATGKIRAHERFSDWLIRLVSTDETIDEKGKKHSLRKAVKCDMCKGYDYYGCKHNCPTGAILTVEPREYFAGGGAK